MKRFTTSIVHFRRDLSYQPTTPRVPLDETEYARGIDYYLKFGTRAEATEIVKQIRDLLEANNSQGGFTVDFKVTGGGADQATLHCKAARTSRPRTDRD